MKVDRTGAGGRSDAGERSSADGARAFLMAGHRIACRPVAPGLHIVATPIGNLGDVTLRALETLAGADVVLAEDTRVTRVLLDRYGIGARLLAHHAHNERESAVRVLVLLAEGRSVALVTDAGTPLISDPGQHLVAAARGAGHPVIAVPGPSALTAALSVCGVPAERFFFEGFLPARAAARRARLVELAGIPAALVFYEAPHRLAGMLADAASLLPGRDAAIARELTKRHEEVRHGSLQDLAAAFAAEAQPKGEIVVVLGAPSEAKADDDFSGTDIDARLAALMPAMSLKEAVARVAADTGQKRRIVYARALALTDRT